MKKASFTKIRPRSWMDILGRSLFLILLACTVVSTQFGMAQSKGDVTHPLTFDADGDYQPSSAEVTCSETKTPYTDDNHNEAGLYYDRDARTDTLQFCGTDPWHKVLATFNRFDLAVGDTLFVYDGDITAIHGMASVKIDTLTGTGVSNANGGWVSASCSPSKNPSGCLTFIFKTNGDNAKGTGWEAWMECTPSNFSLEAVVENAKFNCGDLTAWVGIPVPTFAGDCTGESFENDSICLIVRKQNGDICPLRAANLAASTTQVDTLCGTIMDLRYIGADGVPGTAQNVGDDIIASLDLGPGQYSYEIYLTNAPSKRVLKPFSVSLPSLVCNDEVEVPLNSGCGLQITPDDILENPCFAPNISYELEVVLGNGAKTDTTITHTILTGSGSSAPLPALWIPREVLQKFEGNTCNGSIDVKITRGFTPTGSGATAIDLDGIPGVDVNTNHCNNGIIRTSCTTTVNFRDLTAPAIQVHSDIDTIVACNGIEAESLLGSLIIDNCDKNVQQTFHIDYDETDGCFSRKGTPGITDAKVTIIATDACGNESSTTRDFVIKRPSLDRAVLPPSLKLQCDDYGKPLGGDQVGMPGVEIGYIRTDGSFVVSDTLQLSEYEYICGYILTKEIVEVPETDCGQKEIYEWKVIDWCDSSNGPSYLGTQFVEYTDTVAPIFTGVGAKATNIDLGHFECTYDAKDLPRPEAEDNCSQPNVFIDAIFRLEDGTKWNVSEEDWDKLDSDSFEIRWIVEDACHNQFKTDTANQIIVIQDVSKPSVITTDELIVSVPNDWGAIINVKDVDAGSYDACGIAKREIRREDDPDGWDQIVTVGCEDIGKEVRIYLRITDIKGNQNTAWMIVKPEDRIAAVCEDLETLYLTCDDFDQGPEPIAPSTDKNGDGRFEDSEWIELTGHLLLQFQNQFGQFDCSDNLSCTKLGTPENSMEEYQLISTNCGQMEIRRRFRLRNDANHQGGVTANSWSHQTVKVGASGNWKVTLPADVVGQCKDDISRVVPPIVEASACDVIAWEVEDKVFGSVGDACIKIERTYHVINWCNYSAGGEAVRMIRQEGFNGQADEPRMVIANDSINKGLGYFTYIQILKIQDHDAPVVVVDNPEDACINGVDFDALPYGEEDITPGTGPFECDEEKTWTAWADDCTEEESIRFVGRLYNSKGELVKEVNSPTLTYAVSSQETYYAEFWAYDGCGNSGGGVSEPIQFSDCRPPVAYLLNGVALNLTNNGTVEFWASDVDRGSFDNCTDQSELGFYVLDPNGDIPAPNTYEEVIKLPQVIEYDCFKVGMQAVTVYVVDEEGNYDFATASVNVQDNNNVCQGLIEENIPFVAGKILNSDGESVEEVEVSVNGGVASMMTDESGKYQFKLAKGNDYTITPEKDIDPLNGVSTFDLVLISKHILGIETLNSPYKQIAADVNKSGTITAYDMVQLRQLILNVTSEFPNNESWRFVDASHEFSSTPLSDNFNEFRSINNLATDMMETNFIAIKVGDVNENAAPNSLASAEVRTANQSLTLQLNDQFVEKGQTIKVEVSTADLSELQGYQFTMNYEGLLLEGIEKGIATQENFNTNLRNAFTTSWNKTNQDINTNKLFTLNFTATTGGKLSELLSISSDYTAQEAYNQEGEVMDIQLAYVGSNLAGFELLQNKPNPFNGFTQVGFNLPEAGEATLKVLDVQGKILSTIDGDFAKGYNEIQLDAKELRTTGVLYYQLETTNFVATRKMIIID